MASATVVAALDNYWNEYEPVEQFNTVAEMFLDCNYRDAVTPDVTYVNDKAANTFWKGTTDVRTWKPETQRSDTITTLSGLKLYPSFDKYGNRLLRHFDTDSSNVTFRIRTMKDRETGTDILQVDQYRNRKGRNGQWTGDFVTSFSTRNTFNELSEQRVTYWIMRRLG